MKLYISKQREILHSEIDRFIEKLNSHVDKTNSKLLDVLNEKEVEYTNRISEIKQSIADLKTLQDSNDICLVSTYNPRNDIFRRVPTKLIVPTPVWYPVKRIKIHEQFGFVVWSSITETKQRGYIVKPTRTLSFLPDSAH